jgi:membrane-bound serine protease (ClpP class)
MIAILLLFAAGVILIFSEFFVPGIILGVVGTLLVVASVFVGWRKYPEYGIFIFSGELLAVVAVVSFGLFLLAKTPLGRGFVLKAKQETGALETQRLALVGKVATVHTALRPAGSIMIDRERIDAVSNGMFIDAGKSVRIIQVEGHRVVCEEEPAPAGRSA